MSYGVQQATSVAVSIEESGLQTASEYVVWKRRPPRSKDPTKHPVFIGDIRNREAGIKAQGSDRLA